MDRLPSYTRNPQGQEVLELNRTGFEEATMELLSAPGTIKTFSAVAGWLDVAQDNDLLPAEMGVNFSGAIETFNGAAAVCALPLAIGEGIKMYGAGRRLLSNCSMANVRDLSAAAAKTTSKTAETFVALHRAHVVDLGATGFRIAKVFKSGGDVIADAFEYKRAVNRYEELQERGSQNMSQETYNAAQNEAWWGVAKAISALGFHLSSLLLVIFSMSLPMFSLVLATVYTVANIVYFYSKAEYKGAMSRDFVTNLNTRLINYQNATPRPAGA